MKSEENSYYLIYKICIVWCKTSIKIKHYLIYKICIVWCKTSIKIKHYLIYKICIVWCKTSIKIKHYLIYKICIVWCKTSIKIKHYLISKNAMFEWSFQKYNWFSPLNFTGITNFNGWKLVTLNPQDIAVNFQLETYQSND